MGEATHGSSEFQRMKDRVFRTMVSRRGFTVFALEAQMGLCRAIDRYVLTGEGDPTEVLVGQGYWVWSTQEMLHQIEWMRAYNADPAHPHKLRFFGYDMQDGGQEIDEVVAFLKKVDAPSATQVAEWYEPYRPFTWKGRQDYTVAAPELRARCREGIQKALQWLLDHQTAYAGMATHEDAAFAAQCARVVMQNEERKAANGDTLTSLNIRDRYMAENIAWYVEHLNPEAGLVVSAHNGHINKGDDFIEWESMGEHLSKRFGKSYGTLGFAFNEGGLIAVLKSEAGEILDFGSWMAKPAPPGSYEEAFVQAGSPLGFLDMRTLDSGAAGARWLNGPHDIREVGSVWIEIPNWCVGPTELPKRFDGLIWIEKVTATTLLD